MLISIMATAQWYDFIGNIQWDTGVTKPVYTKGMMFYDKLTNKLGFYNDDANDLVLLGKDKSENTVYKKFEAENEIVLGFTNITINTTSPINGVADYEVDSFPAALPNVSLSPRNLNKRNTMTFEYTLASGTAKIAVSGGGLANPVEVELDSGSTRKGIEFTPTSLTDLEIDITDVSSATDLILDDIVFSDGQRPVKEFTKSDVVTYKGFTSRSGTGVLFKTQETPSRSELITVDSSSGTTRYYANSDLDFTAVYSHYGADASIKLNLVDTGSLIRYSTDEYANAVQGRATVSMTGRLLKGEYVYATASDDPIDDNETNFSISATATAEGTVYASDSSSSPTVDQKPVATNVTAISDMLEFDVTEGKLYDITGTLNILGSAGTVVALHTDPGGAGDSYLLSSSSGTADDTSSGVSIKVRATSSGKFYIRKTTALGTVFGNGTTGASFIQVTPDESNIDNFIVDVGTKHVTGGEEYPTGNTIRVGGIVKPIYARMWEVGTAVTITDFGYIAGLPTNITPTEANNFSGTLWEITGVTDGVNLNSIQYNKSTGDIDILITGVWKVGAGQKIYLPYTKD